MDTSTPDHFFAAVAEVARRQKREAVLKFAKGEAEDADILSYVAAHRGGKPIFLIYQGPGEGAMRQCAFLGALVTQADEIFVVSDMRYRAYDSDAELDTYTHGDLQRNWQAGQRQGISEGILISRYPMVGEVTRALYEYEIRPGHELVWGRVMSAPNDFGSIPELIRQGYAKRKELDPKLVASFEAQGRKMGLSKNQIRNHADWGIARYLSRYPTVFLVDYMPDEQMFIDGSVVDEKGKPLD